MNTRPAASVAYFSMEVGLDARIPTYAGGLGVLAGDTLRSAADLGVPMVCVTLLHRKLGNNCNLYLGTLLLAHLATLEVSGRDQERVMTLLKRSVQHIGAMQQPNGAFETSYEPMLTTLCAWLALRQAHFAGVPIPASADKVVQYLKRDCLDAGSGVFREKQWNNQMRFVTQAGGMRVLYGMGEGQTAAMKKANDVYR